MKRTVSDFGALRRVLAEAPCLSIRQPWVELILLERKRVELRRWSTRHRGWTWLHAGRTVDEIACSRFGMSSLFIGGFVGAFCLRDVVGLDAERWEVWRRAHLDIGAHQANIFGWVVGQAVRLEQPVEAAGSRGLYRPEASMVGRLLEQRFVGEPSQ